MSKKCAPLWREAHFQVKMLKTLHARTTFEGSDVVMHGRCKGFCTLSKVSKTWRFCSISKNDGRCGTFQEDLHFPLVVRALVSWEGLHFGASDLQFWEDDFVWQVQHFVWPGLTFCGRHNTLDRWSGKIAKRIGTRPSALHSTFHYWGKSRIIFRFWCCQLEKLRKSRRLPSFSSLQIDR